MLAQEFPIRREHAAEVLRPGPVGSAVDDDMTDFLRPGLLGEWGRGHERIDLPSLKKLRELLLRMKGPFDIAQRVQADVTHERGDEELSWCARRGGRNQPALQISYRTYM
jgi:hypothetical protein